MERRILIASVLSAIFIMAYARIMEKSTPHSPLSPALPSQPAMSQSRDTALATLEEEKQPSTGIQLIDNEHVSMLESDKLLVEVGEASGAIRSVTLKEFLNQEKSDHLKLSFKLPIFSVLHGTRFGIWRKTSATIHEISFVSDEGGEHPRYLTYRIDDKGVAIEVFLSGGEISESSAPTALIFVWGKGDVLSDRQNALEVIALTRHGEDGKAKHVQIRSPVKSNRNVPRGTHMLTLTERYFCQSVKFKHPVAATILPSGHGIMSSQALIAPVNFLDGKDEPLARIYFGPRDFFQMRKSGFEQALPIGVLGQIGLGLLLALSAIAKITVNYGVAIIAFSIMLSIATAPFSLISFKSMKKMQELKPHIERITKDHKENQLKANQHIMALYREHKVSPMSGCLPMLLQLPIFIALFQAISHFIELRGKTFLWVKDLSLPDHLATIGGFEINALPVIMAGAMFLQTKISQQKMGSTDNNPMAAMMSGPLFSAIFAIVSYQFPAGLILYWLTNTLASVVIYKMAK